MLVKDIMSKEVLAMGPQDTVSKFISLMEQHHIHEAPVVDDKKYLGMVHYKAVAGKGITDPSKEKLKTVLTNTPTLKEDDTLDEAADSLFQIGFRALPVVAGGKLSGIISVFDLLAIFSKQPEFKTSSARDIMSPSEVISIDDDIGKARVLMREKNISRQPVVDKEGKLRGVVAVFDLLKAVKPRERIGWYSMAAEKETIMGVQISTVMNDMPLTAGKLASLKEIADMMAKYKNSGVIITEDDIPIGIVTTRDLLEFYLSTRQRKGAYVQITGLGTMAKTKSGKKSSAASEADTFVATTVDRMVRDSLQKITSFMPVQFLYMHVKKHRAAGGRIKYSVRCRLMTDKGTIISRSSKWDLRDAAGEALDELEKVAIRDKERLRDRIVRNLRALKRSKE